MEIVAQKHVIAQKRGFASLAGFLRFHTNNGFLHWKNISNFRHLALYSKQFQTFNFAPKFQNF